MLRISYPRWLVTTGLLCSALSLMARTPDETGVWEKVSSYLTKEAKIELEELPEATGAEAQRERDFCTAVVLLDQQPLTESRLDDAEARLQQLLREQSEDEIANACRYLLGRIAQVFRDVPRIEEAAAYYREALHYQQSGEWAKQARMRLAVLELYVLPAATRQSRLKAVEALIEDAEDPVVIRDLHRLAARGVMFFNLPSGLALKHLLAAEKIGGLQGIPGADQLVQIGELAMESGQPELSAHYYERLRRDYPRDARIFVHDRRQQGLPVPTRKEELNGR